jgi:hypothetical protein
MIKSLEKLVAYSRTQIMKRRLEKSSSDCFQLDQDEVKQPNFIAYDSPVASFRVSS